MSQHSEPTRLTTRIARRLRARMAEGGLTQSELASASGISQSQLSKYLRGVRVLDVDQLDTLCRILNLPLLDVIAGAYAPDEDDHTPLLSPDGDRIPAAPEIPDWTQLAAHQPGYSFEDELAERMETP